MLRSAQGDVDLPRITVIGKQSAGKSSLVEAISGYIRVPRDAGTCTRCPMECRLSSSGKPWSCKISIRQEYNTQGQRLAEVTETAFGNIITNKDDVEIALRQAQFAVLHPNMSYSDILSLPFENLLNIKPQGTTLLFSRNVVCVDLEGPELTDLSFVDLPGLIENAEPTTVKFVENLVTSYIQGNCLILVALPVTDDIENHKALLLARTVDPLGRRTIGVMTKLDLLTAGATTARTNTEDARAKEAKFFSTTSPWATSVQRQRLGTTNLISALSSLLMNIISESLPNIHSEASVALQNCKRELANLPPVVDQEPSVYILTLLTRFCEEIQLYIRGSSESGSLIQSNKLAYDRFKSDIKRTRPNFKPFPDARQAPAQAAETGDSVQDRLSAANPVYLEDMRSHITRSMTRELPNNVPFNAKVTLITAYQSSWDESMETCFDDVKRYMLSTLNDKIVQQFHAHERLQNHIRSLVSELVHTQYDTCMAFLQAALESELAPYTQNHHYLETCTHKWLAIYRDMRSDRRPIAQAQTQPQRQPAFNISSIPSTVNEPASPFSPIPNDKINSVLALLAEVGYTGLTKDDLGKLNPPDEYETELKVMAEIRAYFQVSYKRIIDNIPLLIDLKFVRALGKELLPFFISKFELGTSDSNARCAAYLAEAPLLIAKREELLGRKRRLESVQRELHKFGI
ncbi:P-loop containing nucleoside triphosphate hydrolase protein [Infundibulicybe gibba]|nr:P-loop containing nucleoside triphosphate hydrolase protein [Infundibulicybe gibba]